MKKFMIYILLAVLPATSFCQKTNDSIPHVTTDYLTKSKNQKEAAWALLGGGAAFIGLGFIVGDGKEASFDDAATGGVLAGVGLLSIIGSIPLFIASGKNKRKAKAASVFFKMEKIPELKKQSFVHNYYPSLSLKIGL